jgi:C4-dicarboxylate-specific signal transduction histidine kinase
MRAAQVLQGGLKAARRFQQTEKNAKELRQLNSHMVQAEKLASLGQIAAGVVHELNNPLTSIVAYTDYLARKAQGRGADPDELERLRRINESAGRMLRFTRDLVTYARPSSETPVPVSLHTVLDQALAFCEHVLDEAGAKVERQYMQDLPTVTGMPEQLAQVFVNLVTNACHAMPKGQGVLIVATSRVDGKEAIRIVLEDNGHGITDDHLPQIFAPFFTTKTDGRGTGLGLSIVKNILDNHTGEIRAERANAGGTRFTLVLPTVRHRA